MTDVTGEDVFAAVILGVSVKLSAIIHDAAASAGLDVPLTLASLILVGVLIAANYPWEGKRP